MSCVPINSTSLSLSGKKMKQIARMVTRRLFVSCYFIALFSLIVLTWLIRERLFVSNSDLPAKHFQHSKLGKVDHSLVPLPSSSFIIKSVHRNLPKFEKESRNNVQHFESLPLSLSFDNNTFRCGVDGIITILSGGRLGNQMGEYATLLALAKRDQLFPILQERTSKTLAKYFKHISIPSISAIDCSLKWNSLNLGAYNMLSMNQRQKLAKTGIFINGYPTSVSLFHRHRSRIVKEFQFKPDILKTVGKKLQPIVKRIPNVALVGVHVRRTDYQQFLQDRFNAHLVGASYFSRAMEHFRQKLKPPVLFVVASDDLAWCRENLQPFENDIIYAGNSNPTNPAEDMALLASCNHSIITYGNFGFWSAYLAGGQVVMATNLSSTPTELMRSIQKANIHNWQFLPGR